MRIPPEPAGATSLGLPLATASVVLRPFVPEDAAAVFAMSREPGLRAWLPDQVYDDERAALEVVRRLATACVTPADPARAPLVLALCLAGTSEPIGHVGLSPRGPEVEVGYAVARRLQGRGLATEAVAAMTAWGLERFALPLVVGVVARDNVASCRVLERAGFALVEESPGRLHDFCGLVRTYHRQ